MSDDGKKKLGRKFDSDKEPEMKIINFRIDVDTEAALEELAPAVGRVRGWRSVLLRRLVLAERDRERARREKG